MGLDIAGNTISQASGALTIDTGTGEPILRTAGSVARPGQSLFTVGGSGTTWVYFTNSAWTKITALTTVRSNRNACFNTALGRFTAPVAGHYLFTIFAYCYKDDAVAGYYIHPSFWVNGSSTYTNPVAQHTYRIRGYGIAAAMYIPGGIQQIYNLAAGDYVEAQYYSGASAGNRYYPAYCMMSGVLLG